MSYDLVLTPVNGYCPPDTFAVTVTDANENLADIAAFNYIIFDDNTDPVFESGAIPVGDAVSFTAPSGYTGYILYIPLVTCSLKYNYVVVRAALIDGTVTSYSADPLQIHTPPCAPNIVAAHVSEGDGGNLTPIIFIEPLTLDPSDTYITSFNAAFQTEDASGSVDVFVDTGLSYSVLVDSPTEIYWYIADPSRTLNANQSYNVAVQAVNSWTVLTETYSTTSCLSNTVAIDTVPGLLPPTDVTATSNCDGSITLNWVPPIDLALQEYTGYNIYYWDAADVDGSLTPLGPISVSGGSTTTYTVLQIPDEGGVLTGGIFYEFYLTSEGNPFGDSPPSNIAGPALSVETPNDVQHVLASSGDERANVQWQNPAWSEGLVGNNFSVSIYLDVSPAPVLVSTQTTPYVDASDHVYEMTFTGLTNGDFYYFAITYYADVLDASAACQQVYTTYLTSDIVPNGLPYVYDISDNGCGVSYRVCSNDPLNLGITQRAIIQVLHYLPPALTVPTNPIFEIQWSRDQYPTSKAAPLTFTETPPASRLIVNPGGIQFRVIIALIDTPESITVQEVDSDGDIVDVTFYPDPNSKAYAISIAPEDTSNNCIEEIRVFASNTTGMGSNGSAFFLNGV